MTQDEILFTRYRGGRILLDSNLLLLYLVGSFERSRIARFKRTADFSAEDFDKLAALVQSFRICVTTPHLLTEVSNLSNALPEHLKPAWFDHFANQASRLEEVFEPAFALMRWKSFNPFGLADAAVHHASTDTLVLTEDFRLSGFLRSQAIAVLNFHDILALAV